MTGTHEQSGLRKPAHRTSEVCAVDGKDLKLFALYSADPAGSVVGVAVPGVRDGIAKLGESRLPFGKLIKLTEGDPTLVLPAISAENRRNQVPNRRSGQ